MWLLPRPDVQLPIKDMMEGHKLLGKIPLPAEISAQQSTFQEQCEIRPFKAKNVKLMEK